MTRALIAGGTDYSRQSFDQLQSDLYEWRRSASEVAANLRAIVEELTTSGFWRQVPTDIHGMAGRSVQLFDTTVTEIGEILEDFKSEVREDHVRRLRRLGVQGHTLNNEWGEVWHTESAKYRVPGTYESKEFFRVEDLYAAARDMAADLMDLSNLAHRLEDFVGRKPTRILKLEPEAWGMSVNLRRLAARIWKAIRRQRS